MKTAIVSPVKLADGSWGARTPRGVTVKVGDVVTVKTLAGKEWPARVADVRGDVLVTSPLNRSLSPHRSSNNGGTRTGCRCGSVEEYVKPSDCWTCKHDAS